MCMYVVDRTVVVCGLVVVFGPFVVVGGAPSEGISPEQVELAPPNKKIRI